MSKKSEIRIMDKAWADSVKQEDHFTCQVCHKKPKPAGCHAHHIIPRMYKETRWNTKNGICLCFKCHKVGKNSAHQNAIWFSLWLYRNKPLTFAWVRKELNALNREK